MESASEDWVLGKYPPIPQAELERREQAAVRLRERFLSDPRCDEWYREQDRKYGMSHWRAMHSGAVLSD